LFKRKIKEIGKGLENELRVHPEAWPQGGKLAKGELAVGGEKFLKMHGKAKVPLRAADEARNMGDLEKTYAQKNNPTATRPR